MMNGRGSYSTVLCLLFAVQLHSEGAREIRGSVVGDVASFFWMCPCKQKGLGLFSYSFMRFTVFVLLHPSAALFIVSEITDRANDSMLQAVSPTMIRTLLINMSFLLICWSEYLSLLNSEASFRARLKGCTDVVHSIADMEWVCAL